MGNLVIVCANSDAMTKVRSQMELIVRTTWSNPPNHGARIVATVLNNDSYTAEWYVVELDPVAVTVKNTLGLLLYIAKEMLCPPLQRGRGILLCLCGLIGLQHLVQLITKEHFALEVSNLVGR